MPTLMDVWQERKALLSVLRQEVALAEEALRQTAPLVKGLPRKSPLAALHRTLKKEAAAAREFLRFEAEDPAPRGERAARTVEQELARFSPEGRESLREVVDGSTLCVTLRQMTDELRRQREELTREAGRHPSPAG